MGAAVAAVASMTAASGAGDLFGGAKLLPLLVLAMGGALAVGNGVALIRPPPQARQGELSKAPAGRSVVMMLIGLAAAVWAVATLTS